LAGAGAVIKEWSSMDEKRQQDEQEKEPALGSADEAIADLEPEMDEAEAVSGGGSRGGSGGGRPTI
jgi:hypothetical protein